MCNLGSVNLGRFVTTGPDGEPEFDFERLGDVVRAPRCASSTASSTSTSTRPTRPARSNERWRPVGLGVMGLQDVFFKLRLPFDSPAARELSQRIQEEIYFHALCDLGRAGRGERRAPGLRRDPRRRAATCSSTCGASSRATRRAGTRCASASPSTGLRNSLLIAIAPTATIASIAGCYECIEPQVSNLFKRETLSGEFLQINTYLVARPAGARPVERRDARRDQAGGGLGAGHRRASPTTCELLYRTAWELPHALADRHGRRPRRRSSTRASR